jgi:hypothetical protein
MGKIRIAWLFGLALIFGGVSLAGCQSDHSAEIQSLNNDMTATKATLQQMTAAIEMLKGRIVLLEQRQSSAHAATPAKKAPPKKSKKKH